MRLRLLLPLLLALFLAACGDEPTTIIAGDDTDATEDAMEDSAVADDSAPFVTTTTGPESLEQPLDEFPTTTASWDTTLETYPLMTQLGNPPGSGAGSGSFVMVDIEGNLMPSGSEEFPHFMITIDSWWDKENDIEFTMSMTNVELSADGQPERQQCANNWAWLSQPKPGRYLRLEGQLPDVRAGLDFEAFGCEEDLPISYSSIFDDELGIGVTETGLVMNSLTSRPYWFMRIDPPAPQNPTVTTLVDIPETTVPETTTTTTE